MRGIMFPSSAAIFTTLELWCLNRPDGSDAHSIAYPSFTCGMRCLFITLTAQSNITKIGLEYE